MRRLLDYIHGICSFIESIVFPTQCVICGKLINNNDICICNHCKSKLHLSTNISDLAQERLYGSPLFSGLYNLYDYHDGTIFKSLMLSLKYRHNIRVAKFIGMNAIKHIPLNNICIDMIIAVPIEYNRLVRRGYNQSYEIAKYIASYMGKPCSDSVLIRKLNSHTQTALSRMDRHSNAKKAFYINKKQDYNLRGKSILLVDDILTTGSTLLSCMDNLEILGVSKVYVFVAGVAT